MKIISIVGPTQSGSTMLFNLVRIILTKMGYEVDSCFQTNYEIGDYDSTADYLIIKCHAFSQVLFDASSLILLPIRDPRDAAVSWKNRFFREIQPTCKQYVEYIQINIMFFKSWKEVGATVVVYEEYANDKCGYIKKICNLLNIDSSVLTLDDIIRELNDIHNGLNCPDTDILCQKDHFDLMMNNKIYRSTLMTKSHNTTNGKVKNYLKCIPEDILCIINDKFSSFLNDNHYDVNN